MIGRTLGQYQIQEQLGSGGMGIVYKAHDSKLDRIVALKFLPPNMSSDESVKTRFIQEARAASALDHANICTIHDVGEDENGNLFIVMSYYDGNTLKYGLQSGAFEPAEAVRVGHQIALGLARAHEAGIVHRDVKPANIMVTDRGDVKILDFGVAKLSESLDLTKAGSTVGTAAYMSPEQARGDSVDSRADIWSIGILLYEMLSGAAPFGGGYEAALVYAIINEDPAPLSDDIDPELSGIVQKCLAKNSSDRFQTADELAIALEAFLSPSSARKTARSGSSTGLALGAESHAIPGAAKIIGGYAVAATVVLTLMWAGMMEFGLPGWFFSVGVVLMVVGLPILLVSASVDRKRIQGEAVTSPLRNLDLKKGIWGGVFAVSGLSVVTIIFMVMRILGIGPAATLVSGGELVENAKLIVADFENSTDDETLGESISELLRIDLSQSDAIQVMDGSAIVSILTLMNRSSDESIDVDAAMEIASRAGAEAVVTGEIRSIGAGFSISLSLLSAGDGSELIPLRETSENDEGLIAAIDRLSAKLREQIGESIKSIRNNRELELVTTSSLDALRLYSQGVAQNDAGNLVRAIELLQQAVEQDSTFGMAYRKLSVVYSNADYPYQLVVDAATKARDLRERIPERERGLADAYYFSAVEGDVALTIAAYENTLAKYPNEATALNNVSIQYNIRGDFEKAVEYIERALKTRVGPTFYSHLFAAYLGQSKFVEAAAVLDRFERDVPGHPWIDMSRYNLSLAAENYDAADSLVTGYTGNSLYWQAEDQYARARYDAARGQIETSLEAFRKGGELNMQRGIQTAGLRAAAEASIQISYQTEDLNAALKVISNALDDIDLSAIDGSEIPYPDIISALVLAGAIDEANQMVAEYEQRVPMGVRRGNFDNYFAKADLALATHDLTSARNAASLLETELGCGLCTTVILAQAAEAEGDLEGAINFYERRLENTPPYGMEYLLLDKPTVFMRLGEIHSELGNIDKALEAYQNFVDIWVDADERLQPRVQYARDRIDQLLIQSTREPSN